MVLEGLRLDPQDVTVRCALAQIYRGTGHLEQAAEELRKAIVDQPHSEVAHFQLGLVLGDLGRHADAISELSRAVALRPNYWALHQQLGFMYYQAGRFQDAAGEFTRVIELQPDNPWGYQMLGTSQQAQGDAARALENYKRAIALGPDARAYTNVGTIYYDQRRFAEAATAFEQAARLEPKSPSKHRNLGDVYVKLQRLDDARRSFETARDLLRAQVATNPRDARAFASLAVCEAKLGQHAQARHDAAEAVAINGESSEVIYKSAVVSALGGRQEEGLDRLAEALKLGYSPMFAAQDEDLVSLRSSQKFAALVAARRTVDNTGGGH